MKTHHVNVSYVTIVLDENTNQYVQTFKASSLEELTAILYASIYPDQYCPVGIYKLTTTSVLTPIKD